MTHMIETTAPIAFPTPMTEAARRFRAWREAEAVLRTPAGCIGGDPDADHDDAAVIRAADAQHAVVAAPVVTLHDLAALVIAAAELHSVEPDEPMGLVAAKARAILGMC